MLSNSITDVNEVQFVLQKLPVAFMLFEGNTFHLRMANDLALTMMARSEDEALNKPIDHLFPDSSNKKSICDNVYTNRITFTEKEIETIDLPNGSISTRYFDLTYSPWLHAKDNCKGVIVTAIEVSDKVNARKKFEEDKKVLFETATALKRSEERYQNYMNQSTEGIWRLELDQSVAVSLPIGEQIELFYRYAYLAECNDAMAKMYGFEKAQEIVGRRLGDFLPQNKDSFDYLKYFIESGYRLEGTESVEKDREGNPVYFRNNLVAVVQNGFVIRAWGSQLDITEKKKIEEAGKLANEQLELTVKDRTAELAELNRVLQIQNETFKQAEESSKQGSYSFNLSTGVLTYSDNLYRLLGFEPDDFKPSLDEFNEHVYPDDRGYVTNAASQVLETKQADNWRYRMITKKGEIIQILSTGRVIQSNKENILVGTLQDITQLIASEELLKQKNEELLQTIDQLHQRQLKDEQKNNFIAMASHELKTPITSIKGYIQVLLKEFEGGQPEKILSPLLVRSSLINVEKQIMRITRLISELLDLTKIESGTLELKKENFSLNELAIEIVQDILYTDPHKQIELFHDYKTYVVADRDRIGQVMSNLLSNAIKYSGKNDKIEVCIHNINGSPAVSVKDHGIGVNAEDQLRIFERFYRAKDTNAQTYPGFGIGLFIVKEFIQRHGGIVSVKSEKGKGSTFTFALPKNNSVSGN